MSQNNENRNDLLPVEENGRTYWRSLDHVAGTPEFQEFAQREFPEGASELTDPVSRRTFLSLMGASVALAGFGTGCIRRPEQHILPYAKRPEDLVPGLPQHYATTMAVGDLVTGLVVEAHDGRPTKIEGNRLHPASLGAACTYEQAAILSLYDPDRTVRVYEGGVEKSWADFDAWIDGWIADFRSKEGQGLVFLGESSTSPTFARLKRQVLEALPKARFFEWDPVGNDAVLEGTRIAFGRKLEPVFRLERADTVVAVDSDLLGSGPFHLRYARDWASRRAPDAPGGMSRLYAVEPVFTVTGASADHRLRLRSSQAGAFLRVLAAELQKQGVAIPAGIAGSAEGIDPQFVQVLARELASRRGKSVVAVGRHQPAEVQAIGWAINAALGNVGETVRFAAPANEPATGRMESIRQAAQLLQSGAVHTLVILGGNPAYDAPAELDLAGAIQKATNRVHLTVEPNETSALAQWVLPATHFLEEWGDAVALDGTYSVVQPLIRPIWDGRSPIELLSRFAGAPKKGYDLVREYFLAERGGEEAWRKTLHDGLLEGSVGSAFIADLALDEAAVASAAGRIPAATAGTEITFLVDNKVYDGRWANNSWLQELPEPLTKLTWTNAALMGPKLAASLGVKSGERVRLQVGERSVEAGVWVQPGTADDTIAIALGYGRTVVGRIGRDRGVDAYRIRTSAAPWFAPVTAQKVPGEVLLATTQDHHTMEGRPIVREATLQQYEQNPNFAREMVWHPPLVALWKQHEYTGQQWGMSIDLNACIGCNGCMVACQAENNIPVVGPEEVRRGREMHWIRLDRYFAAVGDDPTDLTEAEVVFQPMTCQQCENAPCENVCPVAATVHAKEGGLNDMVYNRCIGTRYCSNNCPYKVRRFNFFDWHTQGVDKLTAVAQMKFNPNVTVRTRGVMEKCTYCIQRINAARREAKLAGMEKVPDGGITPACAQACPTEAIVFGDVNDPNSRVSKLKQQPRTYEVLAEYNTKPRTSYLARIRNPNPELVS